VGKLYIVGTPIGNLKDITLRALEVLEEVDFILCEDTRVTKKLLDHFGIEKPLISYHQHSKLQKTEEILDLLKEGKSLALVSDAGTPGIADPGNQLVKEVAEQLPEVSIAPIPGASAVAAIASVAGFSMDKFIFLGFPPVKKGRKKFFEQVAQSEYPVVFYESPYRIVKTLMELQSILDTKYQIQDTKLVVGRELTKKFETIYRGTTAEVLEQLGAGEQRGEFVVIVAPQKS
jgi:16S rRNA (cytidine1402-2'-O)-methyltransferase